VREEVSGEACEEIERMGREMRRRGGFWPLSSVLSLPCSLSLIPPYYYITCITSGNRKKLCGSH